MTTTTRIMTDKQMNFISSLNNRYKKAFGRSEDVDLYKLAVEKAKRISTSQASRIIKEMLGLLDYSEPSINDVYYYEALVSELETL